MNLLAEMAPQLCKHQDCIFNGLCQVTKTVDGVVHQGDCEYQEKLRAALSAALKHGWKLVPVKADAGQRRAGEPYAFHHAPNDNAAECYRAMIEAAPSIEGDG